MICTLVTCRITKFENGLLTPISERRYGPPLGIEVHDLIIYFFTEYYLYQFDAECNEINRLYLFDDDLYPLNIEFEDDTVVFYVRDVTNWRLDDVLVNYYNKEDLSLVTTVCLPVDLMQTVVAFSVAK